MASVMPRRSRNVISKRDKERDKYADHLATDRYGAKFASIFGTIDGVLSPNVENVHVVNGGHAPAWTNGTEIWLNMADLPGLSDNMNPADLAVWLGLNAHEVGHTLLSPRIGSPLMDKIAKTKNLMYPGIERVEKLAEDFRMERFTIGRFAPWRTYLTAAANRLSIELPIERGDAENLGDLWPTLVGRTWLPADIRKASMKAWKGDGQALANAIGEYQGYTDPGTAQFEDAFDTLLEIRQVMLDAGYDMRDLPKGCQPEPTEGGSPGDDTAPGDQPGDGYDGMDPFDGDDDTDLEPAAGDDEDTENLDDSDEWEPSDGDEGEPCDDGTPGDGEGEGDGEGGNDSQESNDPGDTADGLPPVAGDDTATDEPVALGDQPVNAPRNPEGTGQKWADDLIEDIADAVNADIQKDSDLQGQVGELQDALDDVTEQHQSEIKKADRSIPVPLPNGTYRMAQDVSDELRQIVDNAMPYWERFAPDGMLNLDRFIDEKLSAVPNYDAVWDRYHQGALEDVSLDVTVLLDMSWSMKDRPIYESDDFMDTNQSLIEHASEAVYAIRKACEAAEADCTVLGYSSMGEDVTLHSIGETVSDQEMESYAARGETYPQKVIEDTWLRLQTVEAANKLVIMVTDGQWMDAEKAQSLVLDMRSRGVTVMGIHLDAYYYRINDSWKDFEDDKKKLYHERHRKMVDELSTQMGTDPELTHVFDNCNDLVPLFRRVVARLMRESALDTGGVRI